MLLNRFILTIKLSALLSILLLFSACATNIPVPEKPLVQENEFNKIGPYLSSYIKQQMRENKVMGLSIALVSQDKVVWHEGFGYADKKQDKPVSSETLFRAGSISKFINAIAVMSLVEQGVLDLDTPVTTYLPQLKIKSRFSSEKKITIRNMLSHQSGLPSDLIKDMWVKDPPAFNTALNYLNASYVSQPPDTAFSYSNLSHDLIGLIIESATGESYENYMNTLLSTLDMHNSRFSASPHEPKTALGYEKYKEKVELALRDVPAAGLSANSVDLAQLITLFSGKNTLNQSSLNTLIQEQGKNRPLLFGKRIGLGLFFYDDVFHRNVPIVGHGGATVNHRALIKFSPHKKYGVAILSNSKNAAGTLRKIANEALFLLHEAATGAKPPKKHIRWPYKKKEDIIDKEALEGHYATIAGLAKVYSKGDSLKVRLAGKRFTLYQKQKDGLYYLKYKLFGIFPIKLGNIGNLGIAIRKVEEQSLLIGQNTLGNVQLLGQKLDTLPINEAWIKRAGKYRVMNPVEIVELPKGGIKIVDGFLVAHAKSNQGHKLEFVLQPKNDDEAIVAGIGRSLGETVFAISEGGSEVLSYSNVLFKKIRQ